MGLDRLLTDLGWGAERRATKFVAYFQLLDACTKPGCPVCRCLRELTFRSLDGLLYEQVTDAPTRAVLDRSWGFCAWHAWMATEVKNSALGVAIIYQDLLGQLRTRVSRAQRRLTSGRAVRGWRRLFRRAAPVGLVEARGARRPCPLCVHVAESEGGYLHVVLDYIEDPEFEAAYARSLGICVPHLALALAYFPGHHGAGPLLGQTLRSLDRLDRELRGFIDKHAYRKHAPFTDGEAAAWCDAITVLAGRSELFGHEIPRPLSRPTAPAGKASESVVQDLRAEVEHLKARLARYEPRPGAPRLTDRED